MKHSARLVSLTVLGILLVSVKPAGAQPSCKSILLKPALIDTNGDGPTPGTDGTIDPMFCGPNTIIIQNPWQNCDNSGNFLNTFNVTFDPATNQILSISRNRGDQVEEIIPAYNPVGSPDSFTMTVTKGSSVIHTGTATLIRNGFGAVSGIFFGPPINLELDLVFHIGPGGQPDYVSLPWSQMGALGVHDNPGCGPASDGSTPQIWIPLANGTVDADPTIPGVPSTNVPVGSAGVPAVPMLSRSMTIVLTVGLMIAGLVSLRRGGLGF
jgi:hypothetical protein